MKSNVSTLRWKMWQNKHRSENEAWKNSGLYGICTHDPCNTNRELVIMLVPNEPVKWWINDSKYMKIVSFFQAYFQYCKSLSSVHYCEDRFRIHFFIRSSHMWFSYFYIYLMINHLVILSHRRSTIVALETYPLWSKYGFSKVMMYNPIAIHSVSPLSDKHEGKMDPFLVSNPLRYLIEYWYK